MPSIFEKLTARIGFYHANHVYRRFLTTLDNVEAAQQAALTRALDQVSTSDFGKQWSLHKVNSPADLKQALPLHTYDDYRPHIDRVADGHTGALFQPNQRIHMFATSSGTTSKRKLVPVTPKFVEDYRRGWNTFGLKLLTDHPDAILRSILQVTGNDNEGTTPGGIPYGAITGLLSKTQKRIVRRFYIGNRAIADIPNPRARYYVLMRIAATRDVAFAITANPATLIRMAQIANEESETLIRDIHDGTISTDMVPDAVCRKTLEKTLTANPARAKEIQLFRSDDCNIRPRDLWKISFLGCWTGGSMGHYLERVRQWWGDVPIRDIGLLASEGRVSIPLENETPAGVLDTTAGCFEFIPYEKIEDETPPTVSIADLEAGRKYALVLTNTTGLVRYRLDDVVRVTGWLKKTPTVEFLHRGSRVASVAGEKITENQIVSAVRQAALKLGIPDFDFIATPTWDDPPFYCVHCTHKATDALATAIDEALCEQNEEYASRRKSLRLERLQTRHLPAEKITAMDRALAEKRGSTPEQYKRPCLFTQPEEGKHLWEIGM